MICKPYPKAKMKELAKISAEQQEGWKSVKSPNEKIDYYPAISR